MLHANVTVSTIPSQFEKDQTRIIVSMDAFIKGTMSGLQVDSYHYQTMVVVQAYVQALKGDDK